MPAEIGNLLGKATFFEWKCITFIEALERLSLASNNLKALPEELGQCSNLEELYASNNAKLSVVPPSASKLGKLRALSLLKCPALKQLPSQCT